MKIVTYNVNGIRSALAKNLAGWVMEVSPDIICFQEIKASPDQIEQLYLLEMLGYRAYWYPAKQKGYSGVAILSKKEPTFVEYGCGLDCYDAEGRILRVDYPDFSLMSLYIPSGSSGEDRQAFKFKFLDEFGPYIHELRWRYPKLIVSGDFNICHKPIDIHNPKSNARSSGFLPEEREWLDNFLNDGFIDTFRLFNPGPHQYTWWSYRAGARSKNLGWRLDYHLATLPMKSHLKGSYILPEVKHSDHCPVVLELDL